MAKKKDKAEKPAEGVEQDSGPEAITLRSHPAAMASIRRVRARAALTAFVLVLLLSLHKGVPLPNATLRALAAGIAVQLAAWKISVLVWRQIVLMQIRAVQEAREERVRQRAEKLAKAQEALAAAAAAPAADAA
jgi:hypothetical protein